MNRYSERQHDFLRQYIPGHSVKEVAAAFNRRFRTVRVTASQIRAYKHNHGIKSGTKYHPLKGVSDLWPRHIRAFLVEHNKGKTAAEMTELLNAKFRTNYTVEQVKSMRSRMHLDSGLTGRFEKGHVSHNKGKKGWYPKGSEKTRFRKGHKPVNWMPVGSEVMASIGCIKVKVAEPNKWKLKHVLEWEKHYGKIPRNHCIMFKDGDRTNCHISNLVMITRAENAIMNHQSLRSDNPDVTMTGLQLARLQQKISEIKRKRKHGGEKE